VVDSKRLREGRIPRAGRFQALFRHLENWRRPTATLGLRLYMPRTMSARAKYERVGMKNSTTRSWKWISSGQKERDSIMRSFIMGSALLFACTTLAQTSGDLRETVRSRVNQ
jgi:ABC-type polar amino acid transport system ATPase subunit